MTTSGLKWVIRKLRRNFDKVLKVKISVYEGSRENMKLTINKASKDTDQWNYY